MASINLGTFSDGFSGVSYTCYLIHDTPTRNGDNITIANVKARIVSQSGYGTEGRIGVSLNIPSGTNRVNNATLAASYTYPTDTTYTISSAGYTFSNLTTTFSYSISFSDTGYGSTWNSNYSKTFSGNISCPARTYTVSYNANGGSGAPGNQTKTYNTALTLSATVPTRDGYIFLGWGTSAGATVPTYQPSSSYTGNADLALYAVWEEEEIEPSKDIDFSGIWIMATSKLTTILKNIVQKTKNFTSQSNLLEEGATWITETDYWIIESGTSGVWNYRIWNNGVAECWTSVIVRCTSWSPWATILYEGSPTYYANYPSNLFNSTPFFQASPEARYSTGNMCAEVYNGGSATRTPLIYIVRPNSGSTNSRHVLHMYAIGTHTLTS